MIEKVRSYLHLLIKVSSEIYESLTIFSLNNITKNFMIIHNMEENFQILDQIWKPNTVFINSKSANIHKSPFTNLFLMIYPNGTVWANYRYSKFFNIYRFYKWKNMNGLWKKINKMRYQYKSNLSNIKTEDNKLLLRLLQFVISEYR